MKFAIYQPWVYLHGGIERTLLEITKRSRHEWVIYTGFFDPEGTFPEFKTLDVRVLRPTNVDRSIRHVLSSAAQVAAQRLPLDADVDAVVVSCDGIGDLITVRNRDRPVVCLCFTPLRAAFDAVYERQVRIEMKGLDKVLYSFFKHSFRFVDRLAWRSYSGVVAISGEVRKRIIAGKLAAPDQISLAYPGIDRPAVCPEVSYEPMVLVTGRIMWTKNIELAINAFRAAALPTGWRLVIAGFVDKKSKIYLDQLRRIADGDPRVEFVISPSDNDMADLNRRASFCLFTPRNEDWGIVPLEAMAFAKPVIANDSGGPRESIEHGRTGYLLPPDVNAWAASITKLANDPALVRELGGRAFVAVERFSWNRFVADFDDAVELYATRTTGTSLVMQPN